MAESSDPASTVPATPAKKLPATPGQLWLDFKKAILTRRHAAFVVTMYRTEQPLSLTSNRDKGVDRQIPKAIYFSNEMGCGQRQLDRVLGKVSSVFKSSKWFYPPVTPLPF